MGVRLISTFLSTAEKWTCHNEIRDAIGDLAYIVYKEVICLSLVHNVCALGAEFSMRGVWQSQMVAF